MAQPRRPTDKNPPSNYFGLEPYHYDPGLEVVQPSDPHLNAADKFRVIADRTLASHELAPASGLEPIDNGANPCPGSKENGNPAINPESSPSRKILGLPIKKFWILVTVLIIVIVGGIVGCVVGGLSASAGSESRSNTISEPWPIVTVAIEKTTITKLASASSPSVYVSTYTVTKFMEGQPDFETIAIGGRSEQLAK
ncbi:hypothetical protein QBC43DRAFT_303996 [Cladorrhinum sp. PSN259]|nr:hypothetical protein QBC43DRAFT_303996 [Cladorrhinum sp. PSN259]